MKKESQNEDKIKNRRKNYVIVILIIIIILLLFLLIRKIGKIEHPGPNIPTGNIDIFKIKCECEECCKKKAEQKEDSKNETVEPQEEKTVEPETPEEEEEEEETEPSRILVYDEEKEWDNLELRIFSNPAFEYQNKIAPGSYNSYMFIIQNINDFDVNVKMKYIVENDKNINMKYKLRSNNTYYVGSQTTYETIDNKEIKKIEIPANEAKTFILDWKWIDNNNDAAVGFDITSYYKLSIDIGANQKP